MKNKEKVAVIGLGFVGLPLALSFSMEGAKVYGVDVNEKLVEEINEAKSHHTERYNGKGIKQILREEIDKKTFKAYKGLLEIEDEIDTYILTVGIPTINGKVKTDYIVEATKSIAKRIKKHDTVIVRSTVIPGMTRDVIKPILEESGLIAGEDFYLAYASERIAEGRAFEEFRHMPLCVGGINQKSGETASELLGIVTVADIHLGSSMEVVETSKVIENVQRDVNIAMVQEFARFSENLGIDTFELIRLANTHTRVNLLIPGCGVGGYCIPNAYHYLSPKVDDLKLPFKLELLEKAREINRRVPDVMVEMIEESLNNAGKKINESKIAVFGLAMKDFSNDDRISPAVDITNKLINKGADVKAFDPAVPTEYTFKSNTLEEAVENADILVFLVEQEGMKDFNYEEIAKMMNKKPILFDTKNVTEKFKINGFDKIVKI